MPVPMVVGQEFVGVIDELGSDVRGLHVGELVTGEGRTSHL